MLKDWSVFPNFGGIEIELCSATYSVPRQPFSPLYARKVAAKGVPMFINRVPKIESELAISLRACVNSAVPVLVDKAVYTGYQMHNTEGSARY